MAQLITVRLSRVDAQPWGLRLQGGKDFGTPLVVQKVNIGSIADQGGLIAGDAVIKVNNVDVFNLRHKDAQDIIVRSGNSFEITIQRGGSTWRPSVTPTGAVPSPTPSYGNNINTVTKTSLAHKQQESQHIGCGYNNAARPFQNGNEPVKSIVNKQYNTPVGIYSEESIAETLSAQAEVLAGGVLGVNFKKNEKVYNSAGSEVLKALQESENDPADPAGTNFYWTASHAVGGAASLSRSHTPSQFQVAAESNKNGNQEEQKSDVQNVVPVQPKPVTTKPIQPPVTAEPIQPPVIAKPEQSPKVSPCDECGSSIPNTKLSASTISAALNAHHGNLPHQNGTSHNNNLPSNLGSPKPYSYGSGPPPAGPKSPSSYPPPNWSQPKQQAYAPPQQTYAPPQQTYAPPQQTYAPPQQTYAPPKPTYAPAQNYSSPASNFNSNNFGSNTLPRSVGQSAPDVPHEKTESVQKPVAVTVSSASTIEETKSSSFSTQSQQYRSTVSTTIPSVQELRPETVSMPSQSLELADKRENQRAVSPYRAHTPSMINKPAPAIPYYQQNLVAEECSATSSILFDPRTQSPRPDGCKSPAPGPPPNPLRIHAPRIKSPDPTEQHDTVTQSIDTGISNQFQTQSTGKLLSQHQTLNQSGMQSYVVRPEIVQQSQLGNMSIQSRSNQSELNEQNRSDFQNSSTTQIGNTQIQRNTRVVEEFEHSQKAKTVEIYKSSGRPPILSITAEPLTPKTSCFLQKSGQTESENSEEKVSAKSSGPGFVAREARRLSTNSQYKADLAVYQSSFPQFSCETPPCSFPTKSFHPILEEPKSQSYNVNKRVGAPAPPPGYQQISKPILTKSTQHLSNKLAQITESSASSTLTSATTAMTQPLSSSTPYKPPIAIPVPAFKPPMTSANDFKPSQSAANNFKPTPSSGPGFKPPNTTIPSAVVSNPTPASAGPNKGLTFGATSAPKRGRGILSKGVGPGGRVPQCGCCNAQIRGPFITALGRIWCPDHFVCVSQSCRRPLADIGFVEEKGDLYCEYCFEKYLAPPCDKCGAKIKGDCLNAIGKHYHPECFVCTYCGKLFGNSPFFLEEGQAYCEADWNELFTTKCFACGFPVEAGDRWVEALSHNYHSQCFNCTMCKKNLEGQSFFAKGGRPYCKNHAR